MQTILLALPFALAGAAWNKVPPTIPTHWNLHGEANGWMPRLPGLFLVPCLNVGVCLLLAWLPLIDPRVRRGSAASVARYRQTLRAIRFALAGFFVLIAAVMVVAALGWHPNIGAVVYYGLLGLMAVMGNFYTRLQPSYFMGICTPWTLDDDATWRATHRFAGRFMVFGAVGLLAVGPFATAATRIVLLAGYVLALPCLGLAYSFWFYHRQAGGNQSHSAR